MARTPSFYRELAPRLRDLATALHEDHSAERVSVTVRLRGEGIDYSGAYTLDLSRQGMRVVVSHGRTLLFRGPIAAFYANAERGRSKAAA